MTKQNYDENEYYRNAMQAKEARGAPKPPKQLQLLDFQFSDTERLEELREKEFANYEYRKAWYDRRNAPDAGPYNEEEAQRIAPPLSEAEQKEKEELLSAGFTSWAKRDLANFVRGCELYGRDSIPLVASEVEGKTEKEVAQYACTFFKRYGEIKEWERLMRKIETGEQKLARRVELDAALAKLIASTPDPWVSLRIDYAALGPASEGEHSVGYTPEADRMLLLLAHQVTCPPDMPRALQTCRVPCHCPHVPAAARRCPPPPRARSRARAAVPP